MPARTVEPATALPRLARCLGQPDSTAEWRAPELPALIDRIEAALRDRRSADPSRS